MLKPGDSSTTLFGGGRTPSKGSWLRRLLSPARAFARGAPRSWRVYAIALLAPAGAAVLAFALQATLGASRLSFVFMGAVVLVALRLGVHAGLVAGLAALGYLNFFLRVPQFTLAPPDTGEIANLALFTLVAVALSNVAGSKREEAQRLKDREQKANLLFQASREMSSTAEEPLLLQQVADWVSHAVGGDAFVLTRTGLLASPDAGPAPEPETRSAVLERLEFGAWPGAWLDDGWCARAMAVDRDPGAAVLWRPAADSVRQADEALVVEVLISVASTAIARSKISHLSAEAEALKQAEYFRHTLLSSVSHDFRTPIAAILASATSLQTYGSRFAEAVRDELLSTIVEESRRLETYVSALLNLTQLEAGVLKPRLISVHLAEVLSRVSHRTRAAAGQCVVLQSEPDLAVRADPVLLEHALVNVLENALRFSPAGKKVEITVERGADQVRVEVADHGPGVTDANLPRLFEKFYRVADQAKNSGTGLGLFIARGFLEAMGGGITAHPRADGASGLSIDIRLEAGA